MALKKVKISKWIISILAVIVVSQIIHWIGAAIGMKYYMDSNEGLIINIIGGISVAISIKPIIAQKVS